jgi:hypothetical protein
MITLTVTTITPLSPQAICEEIFDVSNWMSFVGYGPIPGITQARIIHSSESKVGMCFSVINTDGSSHQETVIEYVADKKLTFRMDSFSVPLNKLASHFIEKWEFEVGESTTRIERTFELYPRNLLGVIPLWIVSKFLKKAIQLHNELLSDP